MSNAIHGAIINKNINNVRSVLNSSPNLINIPRNRVGVYPLVTAMKFRAWNIANELLKRNPSRMHLIAALSLASEEGYLHMVRKILNHNASIINAGKSGRWYTPLVAATQKGHTNIVKELLNRGARRNSLALYHATLSRNPRLIKMLVNAGAPPPMNRMQNFQPNARNILRRSVENRSRQISRILGKKNVNAGGQPSGLSQELINKLIHESLRREKNEF